MKYESFGVDSFFKNTGEKSENNKEDNKELMNIYKKIQEGYFYFFLNLMEIIQNFSVFK